MPGGVPDFEFDGAGREGAFLGEEGGCLGRRGQSVGVWGKGRGGSECGGWEEVVGDVPPMVGSLFSWKSLLTKRRTREDWVGRKWLAGWSERRQQEQAACSATGSSSKFHVRLAYLSHCSLAEQHELDATARLRRRRRCVCHRSWIFGSGKSIDAPACGSESCLGALRKAVRWFGAQSEMSEYGWSVIPWSLALRCAAADNGRLT